MKLTKKQLDEIENFSKLQFSVTEIALTIGKNEKEFKRILKNKKSNIYKYYHRGRLLAKAAIRESIYKMADQGSTPAQTKMLELIQQNEEEILNYSIIESKNIKEKAEARLKEIEVKKKEGELLDKQTVIEAIIGIITISKTRLLSLPTKLAPQIVGIESIKKIKSMIEKEVNATLKELSKMKNIQ